MSSLNKVLIIGNLGKEPEIRATQDGREIANLTVATSESWNDKNSGEKREKVEWHRVVIFSPALVGLAKKYLHKWKDTHTTVKENNASSIHTDYLSHCDKDELKYLTVQNILKWKRGDAIWWDEKYLHSSNNFKANNIDNKQFIIIHTHKI